MRPEENKQAVRKFVDEVVNRGNLDVIDDLVHEQYADLNYANPLRGPAAVRQWFGWLRQAYPDVCQTIEDMVAEGDLVSWRATQVGTQKGGMVDGKPTSRQVRWAEVHFVRFRDGKMCEHWGPFSRRLVGGQESESRLRRAAGTVAE